MNIVDLISAAYIAFGAVRGRKRGLADEGYRLLRLAIAFVAGCGLYGLISAAIGKLLSLGSDVSGPVAFIGTIAGAWSLLRFVKKSFTGWVVSRLTPYQALGGAIAGGLRTFLLVLSIVGVFSLAGRAPGRDAVARESVVGKIAAWVMPGK